MEMKQWARVRRKILVEKQPNRPGLSDKQLVRLSYAVTVAVVVVTIVGSVSKAPMSHAAPPIPSPSSGRVTPRWSALGGGQPALPAEAHAAHPHSLFDIDHADVEPVIA